MKQSLLDVQSAIAAAGYSCEIDEAESAVVVQVPREKKQTGPVLQAAMSSGHQITGGRATARGFEVLVA